MNDEDQKQLELLYEGVTNKQENYHYPGETTESAIEKYIKNGSRGSLYLAGTLDLVSFPAALRFVGENLVLSNCPNLEKLPDNLTVVGNLPLANCKNLKSLPINLKVGGYLDLDGSGIKTLKQLPDDLRVVGPISMSDFSEEEIKQYFLRRKRVKEMEARLPEIEGIL